MSSSMMNRDGGGSVSEKGTILAWRNYWTASNYMKANDDKSHLLLNSESDVVVTANINEDIISNSKAEKLLGFTIDY